MTCDHEPALDLPESGVCASAGRDSLERAENPTNGVRALGSAGKEYPPGRGLVVGNGSFRATAHGVGASTQYVYSAGARHFIEAQKGEAATG